MKHKRPPIPVIVLLILVVTIGGYYGIRSLLNNGTGSLSVSGTIEATEISISPETAGKVVEVLVDEGDKVKAGDELFKLDDSLLQAQSALAQAGLQVAQAGVDTTTAARDTAQANYTLTLDAAQLDASTLRTQDWFSGSLPGYSLPSGYFSHQELLDAAKNEVEAAYKQADNAKNSLDQEMAKPEAFDFINAENQLLAARMAEQSAQDMLKRALLSSNADVREAAQTLFDNAQADTEKAQRDYDLLKDSEAAKAITSARAAYAVALENDQSAQDRVLKLQFGESSPKVLAAQAVWNQSEKALAQAQAMLKQAQSQVDLIDLQISKLTVHSPVDGVVLTRNIQPGEMVSLAGVALKIGKLDELSIVVYIPEDVYGKMKLGDKATLSVDSFPGEVFKASIDNIADQAEFTPRNVQTVEGRKATVFAVRLKVEDPSGKLKPGMPADVVFSQ